MSSLSRIVALGVVGAVVAGPLAAQGIPRRATISPQRAASPATRMLIATPYPSASSDSAVAVRVGDAMRTRMAKMAGSDFSVLADTTMGRALQEYGYGPQALLSPVLARTLALNLATRIVLTSTLAKGEGGNRQLTARFAGANDEAGQVVVQAMGANEDPAAVGTRVADAFAPALKALPDGRACMDNRQQNPAKARDAAIKALKTLPNYGLAEYCLAMVAIDQKAPREEIVQHLQNATKGDPLSLPAWSQLAAQFQAANDTAKVLAAYQEILRVAPGDAKIRESIFKYFLQSGHPDLAKTVADEGLKLDPYNADLYDLKSNACLFLSDFTCAVQALEQAYTVDSTRADTLFFAKIQVAAEQRLSDTLPKPTAQDTMAFVRWAKTGVQKYPNNITLLNALNRAYAYSGQVDSSLAITQRLMKVDSTSVTPALSAVQALAVAKRLDQAAPYAQFVMQRGDPEAKEKLAGVYLTAASSYVQPPTPDYQKAADAAKQAVAVANPQGRIAAPANFIMAIASFQIAANMDANVAKTKSCQGARQEQALIEDAAKGFTAGESFNAAAVGKYKGPTEQFQKRAAALVKAFCR